MDKRGQCYRLTLVLILEMLRDHGLNLQEQFVDTIEMNGNDVSLDQVNASQINLKALLSLKMQLPKDLNGKITNKSLPSYSVDFQNQTILKSNHLNSIETANLFIITENLPNEQKSRVKIVFQAKGERHTADLKTKDQKAEEPTSNKGILDKFFRRDKWNNKHLKLQKFDKSSVYLGSLVALVASTLCGLSFVLKKQSLLKLDRKKAYYQDKSWWMAHSLMVVGDMLHFVAFFFSPAVLICIIQMLMVLVAAVASSTVLGETINEYWKLAFATSLGGCLVIIVHVPKEPHITNIDTFLYMVTDSTFMVYFFGLFFVTIFMMFYGIPKWGNVNSLPYTFQSAIFGSMVVISLKGVLLVFTDKLFHWLPWVCLTIVAICLLFQLEYLTRALSSYNTLVIATQYYVLYSTLVILGSSLLFEVWKTSSEETIFVVFLGFTTIALGVWIFAIFQDQTNFDFKKLKNEYDGGHLNTLTLDYFGSSFNRGSK